MATPPSSAADRSLRPPSRRPIGVRAPATMTDPDMTGCLLQSESGSPRHYPATAAGSRGVRVAVVSHGSHPVEGRRRCGEDAAMTPALDLPDHLFTAHRPRRHRRPRPRRGDRVLPRHASAWTVVHEETNEEQGVREAMVAVGDSGHAASSCSPRSTTSSTIAKFLDRTGPGLQQLAYRVTDVEQVSAVLRERGLRLLYDEPAARHRRTRGSTSSTPRTPAACSSSSSSPPTPRTLRDSSHPEDTAGYPSVISRPRPGPRPRRPTCSRSSTPSSPATPPREDFAALDAPRVLPRRDGPQGRGRHVRGPGQPRQGPAQVAARRGRRRCPSSARARRSSP